MQKDRGKLGRLYRDIGYETFVRTGDIYQLFYERGCQLLKDSTGLLAYITSNSWLKAEYGKRTRRYFSERHTPLALLELGKDVFESAIVDSSVLLTRKAKSAKTPLTFEAVDVELLQASEFPPDKSQWGRVRAEGEAPWSILSRLEQSVMNKMLAVGTPLKEWDIRINYGIKTGYNKAFIIDNQTKEALVAEDPKSAEILKPVLNARLIRWFLEQVAPTSGMGTLRWKKVYVELLPIPKVGRTRQDQFVHLVDRILYARDTRLEEVSSAENAIDSLVYELYGLEPDELRWMTSKVNHYTPTPGEGDNLAVSKQV